MGEGILVRGSGRGEGIWREGIGEGKPSVKRDVIHTIHPHHIECHPHRYPHHITHTIPPTPYKVFHALWFVPHTIQPTPYVIHTIHSTPYVIHTICHPHHMRSHPHHKVSSTPYHMVWMTFTMVIHIINPHHIVVVHTVTHTI